MSAVATETLTFWSQFDAHEPSAELGGIYAAKGGYHDTRTGAGTRDYSVAEVADDRLGPADKASGIDLTMSDAAMRLYSTRMDNACRARDERLFIDGRPVIREFIGTKDSRTVYCYVLTGGRARGLPADASPDYGRDSSHLWHMHISIIRRFLATKRAYEGLISILRGESLAAWRARTAPAVSTPEEESMSTQIVPVPPGFAFDETGNATGRAAAVVIPVEPVGVKGVHAAFAGKALFVSLAADLSPGNAPVKVRVAINDGAGWAKIATYDVRPGPRVPVEIPPAVNGAAYTFSVGRQRTSVDTPDSHGDVPLSVLVTIA